MARAVSRALIFLLIVAIAYGPALETRRRRRFAVYRTAGARAATHADLYRDDDGHYQYKYLPLFAFAMIPFAAMPAEAATAIWFVLTAWMVLFIGIARAAASTGSSRCAGCCGSPRSSPRSSGSSN